MRAGARATDIGVGVCVSHKTPIPMTGAIVSGSGNVTTNGLSTARMGDIVLGGCGHIGVIVTGSATVTVNAQGMAHRGDAFVGSFSGVIVSGFDGVVAA